MQWHEFWYNRVWTRQSVDREKEMMVELLSCISLIFLRWFNSSIVLGLCISSSGVSLMNTLNYITSGPVYRMPWQMREVCRCGWRSNGGHWWYGMDVEMTMKLVFSVHGKGGCGMTGESHKSFRILHWSVLIQWYRCLRPPTPAPRRKH